MAEKRILTLRLKRKWWEQIRDGIKTQELREQTDYWRKRLVGQVFDEVHLWLGYPPATETAKLLRRRWRSVRRRTVTHEQFGAGRVAVFAIDVSQPVE